MVLENVKQIHMWIARDNGSNLRKTNQKKVASFGTTSEGHTLNRPQTHPSKTRRPYQRVLNNHQPLLTVFWSPIELFWGFLNRRGNVANDWKKTSRCDVGWTRLVQVRKTSGLMSRRNGKSFWCTWPATTNGKKRCLGPIGYANVMFFLFAPNHSSHG